MYIYISHVRASNGVTYVSVGTTNSIEHMLNRAHNWRPFECTIYLVADLGDGVSIYTIDNQQERLYIYIYIYMYIV